MDYSEKDFEKSVFDYYYVEEGRRRLGIYKKQVQLEAQKPEIVSFLNKVLPKKRSYVLEIGCWLGDFGASLRERTQSEIPQIADMYYFGLDNNFYGDVMDKLVGDTRNKHTSVLKEVNQELGAQVFNRACYTFPNKLEYDQHNYCFRSAKKVEGEDKTIFVIHNWQLCGEENWDAGCLGNHMKIRRLFSPKFLKERKFDCIILKWMARWLVKNPPVHIPPFDFLDAITMLKRYTKSFLIMDYQKESFRSHELTTAEAVCKRLKGFNTNIIEGEKYFIVTARQR